MSIARYDSVVAFRCLLVVFPITFGAWFLGIFWTYQLPQHNYWKALLSAAFHSWQQPKILFLVFIGFWFGFMFFILLFTLFKTNFNGAYFSTRLRGPRMASEWMLRMMTKEGGQQLNIGKIKVPSEAKALHFLFMGATGVGKSQGIESMIESADKTTRIACIDPNGTFMSKFFKEGDVILNPFDSRCENWSIFNEIRSAADCELFAVCIIPKAASSEREQWNSMARVIVSETMVRLKAQGKGTTDQLLYWLMTATNDELGAFLKGSAAAGMFHGASETLGSVRTVLTAYVKPHSFMPNTGSCEGGFSIRDWVESGQGNVWVTWRQDMLEALRPLISCWTDVIAAAKLSVIDESNMLFVVDELDSLEKLNYLLDLATKGRKHKVTIVAGIQSLAQLNSRYGKEDALTLRNNLRTVAAFGISNSDTYTPEQISIGFGEHDVVRTVREGGIGKSQDGQTRERVIMPSEITGLPNLTGYLKFPGELPIAKFKLAYKKREEVIEPFIMAVTKWTVDIGQYNAFTRNS
jgi:type IV secretory pathway TraG/TraD family ATPase VirD4